MGGKVIYDKFYEYSLKTGEDPPLSCYLHASDKNACILCFQNKYLSDKSYLEHVFEEACGELEKIEIKIHNKKEGLIARKAFIKGRYHHYLTKLGYERIDKPTKRNK